MNPIQNRLLSLLIAVCLLPMASLLAGTAPKPVATKMATILSVDTKLNTLTIDTGATNNTKNDRGGPHNQMVFNVTPFTTITVNGLNATLADLKAGLNVTVTIGMDRNEAASIAASGVPPKPQASATPTPAKTTGKAGITFTHPQAIEEDQIQAIGTDTITVGQVGGKKLMAYKVTAATEITVNGAKADIKALRTGMGVEVRAGADLHVADKIIAHD